MLGNTYDLPASDLAKIRRDTRDPQELAAGVGDLVPFQRLLRSTTRVRRRSPEPGAKTTRERERALRRDQFWPILKDLSMYAFPVDAGSRAMREPLWHPVTADSHGEVLAAERQRPLSS